MKRNPPVPQGADGFFWCASAVAEKTAQGTSYWGLSNADMLKCQLALREQDRKSDRIASLQEALSKSGNPP